MKISEYITVIIGALIFLLVTGIGKAEESKKQPIQVGDTDKLWAMAFSGKLTDDFERIKAAVNVNEPNNEVTVWMKNEWEDIKSYQRQGWADGKDQLQRNKESISGFFQKISDFFQQ